MCGPKQFTYPSIRLRAIALFAQQGLVQINQSRTDILHLSKKHQLAVAFYRKMATIPTISATALNGVEMKKKWLVIALFLCTLIGVTPSALATTTSDAGADANLDAAAVVAPETDAAPIVGAVPVSDVAPTAEADMERLKIQFENGIHYIEDPDYPGKKITLFCMNNLSHWPHHTQDMDDLQVPDYVEGYLTPEHFKSEEDYNECMRRLSKLLYAGYPYNGEDLYKIVANSSEYTPTEEEFNKMLVCPPRLADSISVSRSS